METTNTTILSSVQNVAQSELRALLDRPLALIVVLGAGPAAETTVQLADHLCGSGSGPFPRRVAWARTPLDVADVIGSLECRPGVAPPALGLPDRAFSISRLRNLVSDVIAGAEETPDLFRLFSAFVAAELPEDA